LFNSFKLLDWDESLFQCFDHAQFQNHLVAGGCVPFDILASWGHAKLFWALDPCVLFPTVFPGCHGVFADFNVATF